MKIADSFPGHLHRSQVNLVGAAEPQIWRLTRALQARLWYVGTTAAAQGYPRLTGLHHSLRGKASTVRGGSRAWLVVCCAAFVAAMAIIAATRPTLNTLRIELAAADSGSTFQVFYDFGRGYDQTHSAHASYFPSRRHQTLYLAIPSAAGVLQRLRLDPLTQPGEVTITSIAIGHRAPLGLYGLLVAHEWSGEELRSAFGPLNQVEILDAGDGSLAVRSSGADPMLQSNPGLPGLDGTELARRTRLMIGVQDALIAGMFWLVLLSSVALVVRLALRHQALLARAAGIRPDAAFAALALFFGVSCVCVTPPLQFPDEQVHLFRSYQISRLEFFKPRNEVPEDLWRFHLRYQRLIGQADNKTSFAEIASELLRSADPSRTVQHYTSDLVLAYLPQAAGVLVGRLTSGSPLAMMFLGRLFNLIAYILLVAAAIRTAPVFKWTLGALALMPMSVFVAASLSYDAPTIGLAFLFTALVLRHSRDTGVRLDTRTLAALFLTAWGLALMKQPYSLLVVAFLLIPVKRLGSRRRYSLVFAALVCSPLLLSLAWSAARAVSCSLGVISCHLPPAGASAARAQALSMLQAPSDYIHAYLAAARSFHGYWVDTMIGSRLGWLDTPLPGWVVTVQYWFLPAVALVDSDEAFTLNFPRRVLLVGLFSGFLFLIPTLLYIYDPRLNPLGATIVLGVQGRYFIPIAPLALLAVSTRFLAAKNLPLLGAMRLAFLAVVFSSLVAEALTVYRRYYIS